MADDVMQDARERFRMSEDGSAHIREQALEDIAFGRLGEQWPEAIRLRRQREERPCLTINRLPSFIRQVVNDARQNKPSISVHPVEGGDVDTAQVIGGLIRAIERGSNAALAYDHAIDCAATCGMGFFRITTDYAHAMSFEQEARIERVANPFSVHWDTSSVQFDASDWEFAFVSDLLSEREFKRRYPKAKMTSFQNGLGEGLEDWTAEEKIRVAEYWLRTEGKRRILRLTDGRVVEASALDEEAMPGLGLSLRDALAMQGVTVNGEREASFWTVKRRVINGVEVLEETDWPGSIIPIVPVWGEEVIYRGRRHFRSLIRDARDPQAMMNFWRTASTELVALAPRAPWLVAEGAIPPGEEARWATANTQSHPYLVFSAGSPMPQRQPFAGVPAGALQEALNATDDMKAVMGIYDASLGARSNETSGRAIMARQREADVGTFHFVDNLSRAIQYAGRCLIEIIPALYSEREAITILGPDEAERVIRVARNVGVPPSAEDPDGALYDLTAGRYDVTVKVGPSYATQREETVTALMELVRAYPAAMPVLGDLLVKNMDWPGADEAARRIQMLQQMTLQRMMPPPAAPAPMLGGMPPQGMPPGAM